MKTSKNICNIKGFYKYVIEQTPVLASINTMKEKFLQKKDLFFIVNGRSVHLSSLFFDEHNIYYQIHYDVEMNDISDIKESLWKSFTKILYDFGLYAVYSGGDGFHIYSRTIFKTEMTPEEYEASIVRNVMMQNTPQVILNYISKFGGKIDKKMSITKMPVIRFGWRNENKNFAVPLIREFGLDKYSVLIFLAKEKNLERKENFLNRIFGSEKNFKFFLDSYLLKCN